MASLVVITSSNMGFGAVLEYPSQFSFDNCPLTELAEIFPIARLLPRLLKKESCSLLGSVQPGSVT